MDTLYIFKFGMLQVRENEISPRKWSGGTAQLRSLKGTLARRYVTQIKERAFRWLLLC